MMSLPLRPQGAALWSQLDHPEATGNIWLWHPLYQPHMAASTAVMPSEDAWQLLQSDEATLGKLLYGQLADVSTSTDALLKTTHWARKEDIAQVKEIPVMLGFAEPAPSLLDGAMEKSVSLSTMIPPTSFGECAAICTSDFDHPHWLFLTIDDLKPEARDVHAELQRILLQLAGPEGWHRFQTPQQREQEAKRSQTAIAAPEPQATALFPGISDPAQWRDLWQSAQRLASKLAKHYQMAGMAQFDEVVLPDHKEVMLPSRETEGQNIKLKMPIEGILLACAHAQSTKMPWQPMTNAAMTYTSHIGRYRVQIRLTAQSISLPVVEHVDQMFADHVRKYGDLDGDVLLALLMHATRKDVEKDGYYWITLQDILGYRDIKPMLRKDGTNNGSHQADTRNIADCIERLRRLEIQIMRHQTIIGTGHVLDMTLMDRLLTGQSHHVTTWRYRFGEWWQHFRARDIELKTNLLHFDPYRKSWEKRLGRHLLFQEWQVNPQDIYVINIGELFERLDLPCDLRNPARTRQRFETALQQLDIPHLLRQPGLAIQRLEEASNHKSLPPADSQALSNCKNLLNSRPTQAKDKAARESKLKTLLADQLVYPSVCSWHYTDTTPLPHRNTLRAWLKYRSIEISLPLVTL